MAYDESGNMLNYFVPNVPLATTTAGVQRAIDIGAASADHGEYLCTKACKVVRVMFTMTEELAGGTSTAPTVIFTKRPTPLSATGEVVLATLTIPDGTAVGATIFKDITVTNDSDRFERGDSIEISHTVGVGTPTGIGLASFECYDCNEVPANNTGLTASA